MNFQQYWEAATGHKIACETQCTAEIAHRKKEYHSAPSNGQNILYK